MKKTLSIFIIIVLVFLCKFSFAQNNMEDVVYLKNGTIYRGLIIEQNLNQNIKIQTYDWNIIAINFDEIEKILKEIVPPGFDAMEIPLIKFNKRGFINITEMGYGFANTSHDAREGLANQSTLKK